MKNLKKFFALVNDKLQQFADLATPETIVIRDRKGNVDLAATTAYNCMYRGYASMWVC